MIIELTVRNAYSRGGIPLTVQGVANIKVPGEEPLIHASLERFLGKSRGEIMQVARETLEGNLRGVLAILTPEQVNQDKEAFAMKLTEEAEHDLTNIGLILDTLKIQNVTDDVGYLDSIGRMRSADIRRKAQVAEAQAKAQAEEQKWANTREGEIAKVNAGIEIARKENERRIADATTKREAMIAEERALGAGGHQPIQSGDRATARAHRAGEAAASSRRDRAGRGGAQARGATRQSERGGEHRERAGDRDGAQRSRRDLPAGGARAGPRRVGLQKMRAGASC